MHIYHTHYRSNGSASRGLAWGRNKVEWKIKNLLVLGLGGQAGDHGGGDGLDPASHDVGVDGGTPRVVGVFRRGERMGSGG